MTTEVFKNTSELDKTLWITSVETTYRNVDIGNMDYTKTTDINHKLFHYNEVLSDLD